MQPAAREHAACCTTKPTKPQNRVGCCCVQGGVLAAAAQQSAQAGRGYASGTGEAHGNAAKDSVKAAPVWLRLQAGTDFDAL